MSDDRLPIHEPAISEELRQREIEALQRHLVGGKVDQEIFEDALGQILGARTYPEFASVVRSLPPQFELTPASRRRQEPLEISTSMGEVRLEGRWQVGRLTKISTRMGSVMIDLTEAEFDDWDVEIIVHVHMGEITLIAPRGLDVRQVRSSGAVSGTLEAPSPGFPVVRLSASCDIGTIRLIHPNEQPTPRRGWFRRRSRSSRRP